MPSNSYNMSPWSESEVHDLKRLDEGKRFMLDPRVMEWQRQAGPKSQYFSELRNKANVHDELQRMNYSQRGKERDIIDRDMRWQGQQKQYETAAQLAERQAERDYGFREKELGLKEKMLSEEMKQKELERKLAVIKARLNDQNPLVRAQAEEDYNRIIAEHSGGVTPPTAQGAVPPIPSTGANASGGTVAPSGTSYKELLIKQHLDEQRRMEEDRQRRISMEAEDRNQSRYEQSEDVLAKRNARRTAPLATALQMTTDPAERTRILNEMASINAGIPDAVNAPNKGLILSSVGDVFKDAYGQAGRAMQDEAGSTFKTDPLSQARYEAQQRAGTRGVATETVRNIIDSDPAVNAMINSLVDELQEGKAGGLFSRATINTQGIQKKLAAITSYVKQAEPAADEDTIKGVVAMLLRPTMLGLPPDVKKLIKDIFTVGQTGTPSAPSAIQSSTAITSPFAQPYRQPML